jgi:NitT/TauT family transport system substrate-binding protein
VKKIIVSSIFIAAIASMSLIAACQGKYSGPSQSISIGITVSAANVVFFTAESQHYFANNGINLTLDTYSTGPSAITDLVNGKIDIAYTSEYPVVTSAFANDNISIVTNISTSYVTNLVALTSSGISNIADLKGKNIGVPFGTISQFYFGQFLELNGMSISDVTLVNLPVAQDVTALGNGSVDAVVTRDPYESQIDNQYPDGTVTWSVQSSQALNDVLVCRNDWIQQNPALLQRFLDALKQSENYIISHPTEAKAILQQNYTSSNEYVNSEWSDYQFALSLNESLIAAMENEARWTISNNLTTSTQVPNFLNYIYTGGLKVIEPDSVNIIQ